MNTSSGKSGSANSDAAQSKASKVPPFTLICQLEGKLKAAVTLRNTAPEEWILQLQMLYDGDAAGQLSFQLHGYSRSEAETIARTLKDNAFIMREIDEYLWGESD